MDDEIKGRPPYNHVRLMAWKEGTLDLDERSASGWASTPTIDSYDEVIKPTAFTESLPGYMKNPVMYWNHDWYGIPIARCDDSTIYPEEGLWIKAVFGTTATAQDVWTSVAIDKTVRSMSVGFQADYSPEFGYFDKERDIWIWTNLKLMEISVVGMPACSEAQFQLSKSMGLPMMRGYRSLEMEVDTREREWDSREANARIRRWAQTENSKLGCYLLDSELPIADIVDGKPKLAWAGVACAMVRLLGGKGGVDTSQEGRMHALTILRQAYAKCKKPMPEWTGEWPATLKDVTFNADETLFLEKSVVVENVRTCLQAAQSIMNGARHWAKSGRGLSAEVRETAVRSIAALTDALGSAENEALPADLNTAVTKAAESLQALTHKDTIIRII